MKLCTFGAANEVTGSCHLIKVGDHKVLLDCGLIQGGRKDDLRNREPFNFDVAAIDAVVLSHAHIDHSGRLPMLVKAGYKGPIYAHPATLDLCEILLADSASLNANSVKRENRKREKKNKPFLEPLYTQSDVDKTLKLFRTIPYGQPKQIHPCVKVCLRDAGHILGSSIVELDLEENQQRRKVVFSGDLGHAGVPILNDPEIVEQADLVILESTYGNRLHRSREDTAAEIMEVTARASRAKGNILIPAFAVGRSQLVLYWMAENFKQAGLENWQVFLDSPLAIKATEIYANYQHLYDTKAEALALESTQRALLPNLHISRSADESKAIHKIKSGAIIIAGSGMCTGGRILHHLKSNVSREGCHIVIVGYQARGTTGRALVDGATSIKIHGDSYRVAATVHTIGGLSAHADQKELLGWYGNFRNRPRVALVHGEEEPLNILAERLKKDFSCEVAIMQLGQELEI